VKNALHTDKKTQLPQHSALHNLQQHQINIVGDAIGER